MVFFINQKKWEFFFPIVNLSNFVTFWKHSQIQRKDQKKNAMNHVCVLGFLLFIYLLLPSF